MRYVNLNYPVKVKLNQRGKDIYYHRFDHLIERGCEVKRYYPKEDENGYVTFQLWYFIAVFGKYLDLSHPSILEDFCLYFDDWVLEDVGL